MSYRVKNTSEYGQRAKDALRRFRGRILTDIFAQVLVGEDEDEILIWQESKSDYGKKSKNTSIYTNRAKI
jgi:hypothetical protein